MRLMKRGTTIRIAALLLGGAAFVAACSSKTISGTDSSTHWLDVCRTDADCGALSCECGVCTKRCGEADDCRALSASAVCGNAPGCGGETRVCTKAEEGGTPSMGGPCPDGIAGNDPCDGHIAQCWTACIQGFRGQFVCGGSTWTAGHGLFPCGDAGADAAPMSAGGSGAGGSGAGGSGAGGAAGAGTGGSGLAGAGGAAGAGTGGTDAGGGPSKDCKHSQDCELLPTVCCPLCRPAMLSERIAVNVEAAAPYWEEKCATAGACPPCVPSNGSIDSECRAGKCEVVDRSPYTACTMAADCKMVPKDCCACGVVRTAGWAGISDTDGFSLRCAAVDCAPCTEGGPSHLTNDHVECTQGFCEVVSGA
jgi:hypothetical protein